jgi:hypothetical protein
MTEPTRTAARIEALAANLQTECHYGPVAAAALARAWVRLGADQGWTAEQVERLAVEAAAVGMMPDTVRAVLDLTDRTLRTSPPRPRKSPAPKAAGK